MNMMSILIATAIIGVVGLFIGLFLGAAGIKFKVDVNEKEEAILEALPGANCGGCGYTGCSGLAAAIANKEAPVNGCPVGGELVGKAIADIMGVKAEDNIRMTAFVACAGDCDKAATDYEYSGVEDCQMAEFLPNGGEKSCNSGCLGYGSCVKACPFDAIHIENGVAVVNKEACKACGKCVAACPKNIISLIPYNSQYAVACSSNEKGPIVMKECQAGCIGCSICVKQCQSDAVTVENFLAKIDQQKCTSCGACAEKCPKKTILMVN